MQRIVLLMVLAAGSAPLAFAQETINYASISGRVTDESGAVVPGVSVSARQVDTNVTATAVSDQGGRFRFAYLGVGAYEVTASASGFKTTTRALTLTVGAAFDLEMPLRLATIDTTVTVTADAPVLEAARSQVAGTVSRTEVRSLPLNGRNFLDLALLIPGVSPTNVGGGTQLFPETSAVPGVGISVGSQRNLSNNFIVDGLSANDDAAGLSGMSYGVDAIDQFQVVTSGGQAELGRALGGYINIVTRSGTNTLRADGYSYFRDDRFNAANALSGTKLPMHQAQYGASLGGPLVRNRTFVFLNVEQRRLDQSGLVSIPVDVVGAINARLADVGYPAVPVTTGVYPNPVDTTNVVGKVDHQWSAQDHLTVRYSAYQASSQNARGAGGTNAPSASSGLDNIDQTIAAGHVMVLSPRTVLEMRGQVADSDLQAPPADPIGPAVSIAQTAAFGTLSGGPTRRATRMYEVVSNVSQQAGAHAIRIGADVLANDLVITFPRSNRGSYSFSSLANFLTGHYNTAGFTQTFGDTVTAMTNPNLGVYAQDEWKARPSLTFNAGLRYDLQWLDTIETDTNNVSPRFGFVWSPFESRRSLIRGSVGRFYDRVPLRALANALLSAENTTDLSKLRQVNVALSPGQAGAPVFPNILNAFVPSVTLPNLTTMDRHLQNAYADQASLEFERQIGAQMSVSIGYEHLRGRHLIMSVNQNVPGCAAVGNNNGCRPVAAYANNNQYSSVGRSDYDALHVSLVERPAAWGSYRVSYTFSKSMNDVGEAFFSSPIDPFDLSKDWGRSDDDQRHRLVVTGSIHTPVTPAHGLWQTVTHGFELSGMLQYYSALPFNITTGANTIQGTAARPRVNAAYIVRNAGVGSDFSTTSLRLSRMFPVGRRLRVEGLVEAFNLFNRRNDLARVTNFGSGPYPDQPASNFGSVTVVGEPRTLQFGLRFRY